MERLIPRVLGRTPVKTSTPLTWSTSKPLAFLICVMEMSVELSSWSSTSPRPETAPSPAALALQSLPVVVSLGVAWPSLVASSSKPR